ncbi:unnamed protein product [Nippostrongylus brasiliensis]|uniref:Uncharacterized protein n=1 Tax=Nippostrongylus brasiliensis TaxID=27835 RepID=A0A0N4Y7M4_NIPBR|nr:unnamed protein product [Nippostrongylus brasiliensis]
MHRKAGGFYSSSTFRKESQHCITTPDKPEQVTIAAPCFAGVLPWWHPPKRHAYFGGGPTSARSTKSSPIPPPLPEVPSASRHRNKGLETSSAMMELLGGGGGTSSIFDQIPQARENRGFGRRNILGQELQQLADWDKKHTPPVKAPFFSEVDHTQAYERARKRGNWRPTGSQFDQVAQPGPEIFEDSSSGSEQPIDPQTCPAAAYVTAELDRPNLGDDWKEATEDVLETPTLTEEDRQRMMESEPGPDLGDDEVCC